MKIETLKKLIEKIDTVKDGEKILENTVQEIVKKEVLELIDLYVNDTEPQVGKFQSFPSIFDRIGEKQDNRVPYNTLCSCNPANGESGICGCTMANQLVEPSNFSGPYGANAWYSTSTVTKEGSDD